MEVARMMYKNYNANGNNWSGRVSPQEIVDFLLTISKNVLELAEDWSFLRENNRILSESDIFAPIRQLGRTEERYKNEIAIYDAMLTAKEFVFPPQIRAQQISPYQSFFDPYYNPTLMEHKKHCNILAWHSDNIPIYVAIRYGKESIDWILDKFGEEVKRCYYGGQNRQP